jgi:ammonia channel protein AmtB
VVTLAVVAVADALVGLRVPAHVEMTGLDLSQHGEVG